MDFTSRMVSSWSAAASGRATATMASRDIAPRTVLIACSLFSSAPAAAPCTAARSAPSLWITIWARFDRHKSPVPCRVSSGSCTLECLDITDVLSCCQQAREEPQPEIDMQLLTGSTCVQACWCALSQSQASALTTMGFSKGSGCFLISAPTISSSAASSPALMGTQDVNAAHF